MKKIKNLGVTIDNWFDKLNVQWRTLTVKKQHRYMLLLFSGYALLSIVMMLKVGYDVATKSDNEITIEHIKNPVIRRNDSPVSPQDSITTILKHKMYER